MKKPVAVYLHPACAHSPDTIRAVEEATGRVAVLDRHRAAVRLVQPLRLVPATKQVSA